MSRVASDDLMSPSESILDSATLGLGLHPEFKVLDSVIGSHPILMMHSFISQELAPKMLFHDPTVFSLAPASYLTTAVPVFVNGAVTARCVTASTKWVAVSTPGMVVSNTPASIASCGLASINRAELSRCVPGPQGNERITMDFPASVVHGAPPTGKGRLAAVLHGAGHAIDVIRGWLS